LTQRGRWFIRAPLAAIVIAGILVDSWIGEMPLPALPVRLKALESLPEGTAVLELPLGETEPDVTAMYRGMYHRRPVVNGYSGFFPRSYDVLRRGLDIRDPQMFDAVTAWGPVIVAVDGQHDEGGRWAKQLAARPGSVALGQEAGHQLFSLAGGTVPAELEPGWQQLQVSSVAANVESQRIALALDGDPETGWDGGPQRGTEVVTVDLGVERRVDGLTMTIGNHPSDFPRVLVIETSRDGRAWSTGWHGSTAFTAFTGAVRHPTDLPLTFALPHVPARLVRLRQLGQDPMFHWTIFELKVFGQ
jgi:hypothetical protein